MQEEEDEVRGGLLVNIKKGGTRSLRSGHRLFKTGGSKFCGLGVIHVYSPPYFSVFVDYLVVIGDPTNAKWAFPPWRQLGSELRAVFCCWAAFKWIVCGSS